MLVGEDVSSPITSGGVDVLTGSLLKFSPTDYHVLMLREGESARSPEFRRSVAVWRYALASYRNIQKDVARGGGDDLSALAAVVCPGDPGASARLQEESVRRAPFLLGAADAHDFVVRLDRVLADSPALRAYRLA